MKVLLATLNKTGFVSINYMMSLMNTMRALAEKKIEFSLYFDVGKSGVDLPRSQAASYFLNSDCTHMMFIDDDMARQAELINRLMSFDLDIVGVPYRQKTVERGFNMRIETGKDFERMKEEPTLFGVHDIATGLLLIKKNVFETLKDKVEWVLGQQSSDKIGMFFRHAVVDDLIANPGGEKAYMSEDFFFCRLARDNGFKIWAYIDAETAHVGTISFTGNYANIAEAQNRGPCRDVVPKSQLRLMGAIEG